MDLTFALNCRKTHCFRVLGLGDAPREGVLAISLKNDGFRDGGRFPPSSKQGSHEDWICARIDG